MRADKKIHLKQLRRWRSRKKVIGSAIRPRMSVCFTEQHIYVQFIDDGNGVTLASTSTRSKAATSTGDLKSNVDGASKIGFLAAEEAKKKGITKVVFDRNGRCYHGKVKALADSARKAGIDF